MDQIEKDQTEANKDEIEQDKKLYIETINHLLMVKYVDVCKDPGDPDGIRAVAESWNCDIMDPQVIDFWQMGVIFSYDCIWHFAYDKHLFIHTLPRNSTCLEDCNTEYLKLLSEFLPILFRPDLVSQIRDLMRSGNPDDAFELLKKRFL